MFLGTVYRIEFEGAKVDAEVDLELPRGNQFASAWMLKGYSELVA